MDECHSCPCGWALHWVGNCPRAPGRTPRRALPACTACSHALQGMEGLSFGKREAKLGWNAQPTTAVMMDNVKVPEAMRLGQVSGWLVGMTRQHSGQCAWRRCCG